MTKLAIETFFYWDGTKNVTVAAGDQRTDLHADVTQAPGSFVNDPPATLAELARVPSTIREARGF